MKLLFMGKTGELNGVALRCANEGHNVLLYGQMPQLSDVPRSLDWRPDAQKSDLIVVDKTMASQEGAPAALRTIARFVLGGFVPAFSAQAADFLAIWNGVEWMEPMFKLATLDRFLSGDLGATVPNMALALRPMSDVPASWRDAANSASARLRDADYRGPVQFANGLALPQIDSAQLAALVELLRVPLGQTLYDVAVGRTKILNVWPETAIALQISTPPYPFARLRGDQRPSLHIVPGAARHFYAADMSVKFDACGWSGLLGYAAARGRGTSLREAGRRLEHVLSGIGGKDIALQYRTDAISKLESALGV